MKWLNSVAHQVHVRVGLEELGCGATDAHQRSRRHISLLLIALYLRGVEQEAELLQVFQRKLGAKL